MILPTMTSDEIRTQIQKEISTVYAKVQAYIERNYQKFYRAAIKSERPISFPVYEFTLSNNNHYVVIINSKGKKDFKKLGPVYVVLCIYRDSKNRLCAAEICGQTNVHLYISHFFERYAERYLEDSTMNKLDVIVKFFRKNNTGVCRKFTSSKYPNSLFFRVQDGNPVGIVDGKTIVFKTFLTEDMLKGTECEYNDTAVSHLNDYNSKMYPKGYEFLKIC